MQLEGGSDILRALSYYYYNGYAAVAALAGASFEIVANMTRPLTRVRSVTSIFLVNGDVNTQNRESAHNIPRPSLEEESVVYRNCSTLLLTTLFMLFMQ